MTGVQPFSGASGLCDTLDDQQHRTTLPLIREADDSTV
jgi:hypothetical protein